MTFVAFTSVSPVFVGHGFLRVKGSKTSSVASRLQKQVDFMIFVLFLKYFGDTELYTSLL